MEPVSYDEDYYAWAKRNAELVREGNWSEVDAEHIAEELENMGKNQKRELVSRFAVLLAHLLKWQYQPERRSGSWTSTIVTQRTEIQFLLDDSPSLRYDIDSSIEKAYGPAKDRAARETGMDEGVFPESCPYSFDNIIDRGFWPTEEI